MPIAARQPVEPVSPERRAALRALAGYIILGRRPGANGWQGYVEHSFSLAWSDEYVNFWWTRAGRNNGTVAAGGNDWSAENLTAARRNHPSWEIKVFDVHDPDLPVTLDWESWITAQARDPNTLSGVSDKFKARNFAFTMKDEQ